MCNRSGGGKKIGRWLILPGRLDGGAEDRKHCTPLLMASGYDGEQPLNEATSRRALGTKADLALQDSRANQPFGGVVRRFDPLHAAECTQRIPMAQEIRT